MNRGNGRAAEVARYLASIGAASFSGEDLALALARRAEGETIDVDGLPLQTELIRVVPEALALENRILPLHRAGETLFVAVPAGPIPEGGVEELEHLLGLRVEPVAVTELDVPGILVKARQLLRRRERPPAATAPAPAPLPSKELRSLEELGLPASILPRLQGLLAGARGLILLTGPGRSGKTTSLRAISASLAARGLKVAELDRRQGFGALEEALARDPDAVAIDECASPTVASLAVRTALEGRLVLLAVRAPDGSAAAADLAALKVDPQLFASALKAGLNQRRLRRICEGCRVEHRPDPELLEDLRLEPLLRGVPLYRGRGCAACGKSGSQGSVVVFEWGEGPGGRALRSGFQPLVADALAKLVAGRTTLAELAEQLPYTQLLQAADFLKLRSVT